MVGSSSIDGTQTVSLEQVPEFPRIWNIPYQRNPFFTGREDILTRLHDTFTIGKTAALTQPQAISGLGGIGKTQTAVEYAYRYGSEYQAVLWVKADSREVLISDFASIADLLALPEKDEQDTSRVVNAVKRWLQAHTNWLLILDNVEDLNVVSEFIPQPCRGHIVLTTRAQATGTVAQQVEIEKMGIEEGELFLLRRAKIITSGTSLAHVSIEDHAKTIEILQALDGLPLALDQAGAYLEETRCSLANYLSLYQAQHAELLKQRGEFVIGHPESVATTWSLSFEKIKHANPAAADLLRLCAFLQPDAIPEEIFSEGAPVLGPALQAAASNQFKLQAAIKELLKFSLVRRDPDTKALFIHRLVQVILIDEMNEDTQRQWAERTVRAINCVFPDVESATWQQCQKYLPHAQICATLIKRWRMEFMEAARLLDLTGRYLKGRAMHVQAEQFLSQAVTICKQVLPLNDPEVATYLNNLADVYRSQGKYEQSRLLYQEALTLWQHALGPEHPFVATGLNNLALLYYANGMYAQAEPLFLQAIAIWEKAQKTEDPVAANTFNSLAALYYAQGKFSQAEPLFHRALSIYEHTEVPDHPDVATYLNSIAQMYYAQGRHTEAEPLFQRALNIREQALGAEHPLVATILLNYARLLRAVNRESEAAQLEIHAHAIRAKHAQENEKQ